MSRHGFRTAIGTLCAATACAAGLILSSPIPAQSLDFGSSGSGDTFDQNTYRNIPDVPATDWYATDDILGYALDNGLMTGYDNGYFGPADLITRSQVVTVLWRMAGEPIVEAEAYDDVDYSWFYGDAVNWARVEGVATGYAGTNGFGPDDPVTREQLAKMVTEFAKSEGIDISGHTDVSGFADADSISDWAVPYLGWCASEEIITGRIANGGFYAEPQSNSQRCEFAKIATILDRDVLGEVEEKPISEEEPEPAPNPEPNPEIEPTPEPKPEPTPEPDPEPQPHPDLEASPDEAPGDDSDSNSHPEYDNDDSDGQWTPPVWG
ncbi:hypothetical protein B5F79_10515 [Olsenella sp. An285]|uniref:S-layer homology domain-containing protein n=1 Tax=Olsenella sp. An285 TaxID=1965621 RepID=UPI000B3939B0|nr:S-layer homology domain-containing protein [Olsenella sp. An285]OUO45054.1 hypothetical protein B5F79_10515 [Olsenella sp. An285]